MIYIPPVPEEPVTHGNDHDPATAELQYSNDGGATWVTKATMTILEAYFIQGVTLVFDTSLP